MAFDQRNSDEADLILALSNVNSNMIVFITKFREDLGKTVLF